VPPRRMTSTIAQPMDHTEMMVDMAADAAARNHPETQALKAGIKERMMDALQGKESNDNTTGGALKLGDTVKMKMGGSDMGKRGARPMKDNSGYKGNMGQSKGKK
jgi:hypothetical protein